jgi:ketosteroid isomerase-like protein
MGRASRSTRKTQAETTANPLIEQFINALRVLEKGGSEEEMVNLFADKCVVRSVHIDVPLYDRDGASRYWRDYRHTFTEIDSSFSRIISAADSAVLEWESKGMLRTGRPIDYKGATVLTFKDGRIVDFAAYFDCDKLRERL